MKDEIKDIRSTLSSSFGGTGWALCIGAGTSVPLFYMWDELTIKLLSICDNCYSTINDYVLSVVQKYGPDALIQGTVNIASLTEPEYVKRLSELLYEKIISTLKSDELDIVKYIFSQDNPCKFSPRYIERFIQIRDSYFQKTSAYKIAKVISEVIGTNKQPEEIISFNAEPLLYSLLISFDYQNQAKNLPPNHNMNKTIDVITSSLNTIRKNRIKYIFIHGYLPIDRALKKSHINSDKLVFNENEYLQISNSSYSWQSSYFYGIANQKPILFIGLSLSDSNIRKWLAWVQNTRKHDVMNISASVVDSSKHFWIEIDPGTAEKRRLLASLVYHLGIRIIWIDSWDNLEEILRDVLVL